MERFLSVLQSSRAKADYILVQKAMEFVHWHWTHAKVMVC
jgi:hypothetical protein